MSDREPRAARKRAAGPVFRGGSSFRGGARGVLRGAQAETGAGGTALPPDGAAAPEDPRFMGIMQMLEAMGDRMDQQAAAITTALNTANATTTAAAPVVEPEEELEEIPPENVAAERPRQKLVQHFLRLNPPTFTGVGDPKATALWILELENAFELLLCTEAEKVVLAAYQLRGTAATWWKTNKRIVFPEGVVPEWNAFLEAFNEKYFSDCAREVKMGEFQRLRQGTMSVDQYEVKFTELSQYAPELVQRPSDRARRFRDGFRPEVRSLLVPLDLKEYNDLYRRAQLIEKDQNERAAASGSRLNLNRGDNQFGRRPMPGGRYPVPPNRKGGVGKSSSSYHEACRSCGRRHGSAPCPLRTGACYECGQQGHRARDCPRRISRPPQLPPPPPLGQNRGFAPQIMPPGGLNRPPAQGRTYALTRGQAEDAPNVVTGMVLLNDHPAYALFDPGASHSFIAENFVKLIELIPELLESVVSKSTPLKDKVLATVGCLDCKLVIG
ncbi:hypothetical protein ACJRO7_017116 [Eucalyptus globulus]|uniref:CCHC-type domain-containing protein n=1 Tax=Eucalyptus globulus TaxID=34317 RepID=A0ABD3KPZ4_EUCGL